MKACALAALAIAFVLAAGAPAVAKTYVLRYGPVDLSGFEVKFPRGAVAVPRADGFVTRMHARLVDARGRPVTIRDVMLHHVLFRRLWRRATSTACTSRLGEPFYGTGEENQTLRLPRGYGYRVRQGHRWRIGAMLMSHTVRSRRVFIEYRVTVDTRRRLTPVRAVWVRANGCGPHTSYGIGGGGPPGATDFRSYGWQVPLDGRIVAAGGHLHGGAKDMWLSQPRCEGRRLFGTTPRFGMPGDLVYTARPILHEPGPIDTSYFLSREGIAVRRGETLDVSALYDAERPHGVMAIMHIYIARGPAPAAGCGALPADGRELVKPRSARSAPPAVHVPLNALDTRGRTYEVSQPPWPPVYFEGPALVDLRARSFSPPHVSLPAGETLTWHFGGAEPHNVRYANGPRLIDAPTLSNGARFTARFGVPGRYELFCSLHPMTMHQVVDVRP